MVEPIFNDIEDRLLKLILHYDSVIIISAWFSSDKIAAAIEGLSSAILVVSDAAKIAPEQAKLFDQVYVYSSEKGMLHSKYIIFLIEGKPKAVWTGSYNFTYSATLNQENGVFIDDVKVAEAYAKNAEELVRKAKLVAERKIGYN